MVLKEREETIFQKILLLKFIVDIVRTLNILIWKTVSIPICFCECLPIYEFVQVKIIKRAKYNERLTLGYGNIPGSNPKGKFREKFLRNFEL